MCFDKLIVCVMVNSEKVNRGLFTEAERVELIRRVVAKLPNVEVDSSSTLIAEYARQKKACTLVKGLRAVSDYENELQMASSTGSSTPRPGDHVPPLQRKIHLRQLQYGEGDGQLRGGSVRLRAREIIADIQEKMNGRRDADGHRRGRITGHAL